MPIHVRCKTPEARLLLACADARGVLRFPVNTKTALPGIVVPVELGAPIMPQLICVASSYLAVDNLAGCIDIEQGFAEVVPLGDAEITVYFGKVEASRFTAPDDWPTLPDLLRTMPKNRSRVSYLKALQIFSGAHQENIKAVPSKDLH